MPDGAGANKTCAICGMDCSDRPRVKDPKGHYFCRPCYDRALEEKRKKQQAPAAPDKSKRKEPEDAGVLRLDDPLFDDADSSGSGEQTGAISGTCPNCGANFPLAAVICVNCGYNSMSGSTVESSIEPSDEAPASGSAPRAKKGSGTVWPIVIGVLAILIGAVFSLLIAMGILILLLGPDEAGGPPVAADELIVSEATVRLIAIALNGLILCIMLWHTAAGVGLLMRRDWGYRHMRTWARSVIVIVGGVYAAFALLGIVLAVIAGGGAIIGVFVFALMGLVVVALYLAWPIFLTLWLRREAIEDEVEGWA
jgi:hypothetical protein